MPATQALIQLLGEIALLLWGIHMVHTGVTRAYGSALRSVLGRALGSRFRALLAGLGVTAILQSSTATAMMATSFAAGGVVALVPALAIMLGANIGTAVIVQVLSFDLTMLFPALIFTGVLMFRRGRRTRTRDLGRVAIGLGLILLALQLLVTTVAPVEASSALTGLIGVLGRDPLLAVLIAALLAWAAHASVAALLIVMSLAAGGGFGAETIIALVVGANVGSALNPLIAARGQGPRVLRVPIANLANRLVGATAVLVFLTPLAVLLDGWSTDPGRLAVDVHLAFNIVTALVFLPLLPRVARLVERLLPDTLATADPARPVYLDEAALAKPTVALANAARETLRMADVVDEMLTGCRAVLSEDDRKRVNAISRMDDVLDSLHRAIHDYVGRIDQAAMSEQEHRRATEILTFAINLEHAGDIVDQNLMELAGKRIRLRLSLSEEGLAEISDLAHRLGEHLKLAVAVFMFGDMAAARRLVAGKDRFRDLERETMQRHFARVREGRTESVETNGLHLDLVRDFKRIEAHIAATAYPLLESAGQLKSSRLVS